jgi:NAD(P)-dependent dehydrogenase (short-subunit alcohol dehydrogenase family)
LKRWVRAVFAITLLLWPTALHAAAEKRIALLIGSKDYKAGVGALTNPLNDVRIVGEALKAVGFERQRGPPSHAAGVGSIVNVASVRSIIAGGNNIQYDTTKHVVAGLTRGLAMDHGAEGIRINTVCSGPVFTPFHARWLQKAGKTVAQYNGMQPAGPC